MKKKMNWNGHSILNKRNSIHCVIAFSVIFLFLLLPLSLYSELIAKKPIYNFHTVKEGVNVPVWFTLTNSGTKLVRIKEIRTFASCVQSRPITDMGLKPGESLQLDFVFESLGYGGVTINKAIEIHYDDPKKSPLRLYVKGKISPLKEFQAPVGEVTYNYLVLLDIRSPEEYEKGHILGALNVPYEKLWEWTQKIEKSLPSEVLIYVYSEQGIKSDEAVKKLREQGHKQYVSVVGGFQEWRHRYKNQWIVSGTN